MHTKASIELIQDNRNDRRIADVAGGISGSRNSECVDECVECAAVKQSAPAGSG